MQQPLIRKTCLLQKFAGKGGWTYAELPEIKPDPHAHFGWVCVQGTIDGLAISQYHLMPMGNGRLFLPVNATIRKKIGKSAGDWVEVELYRDEIKLLVPPELEACLLDEPVAYQRFYALSRPEQKQHIDRINGAKKERTRVAHIAALIDQLLQKQKNTKTLK